MNDMSQVIVPKSDQISADDFIAGPRSYTIEGVSISPGTEQPVQIKLAGEDRAWKPCKSMSRVLVAAWGPDAKVYAGRSVTLYRDPKVKWGGMEVGGIRISHMSHIDGKLVLQLTATKGKRNPHIVMPLEVAAQTDKAADWARDHIASLSGAAMLGDLDGMIASAARFTAKLKNERPELFAQVEAAYAARRLELTPEGKPEPEQGEGFTDADAEEWGE